jgi:hypothetical protein
VPLAVTPEASAKRTREPSFKITPTPVVVAVVLAPSLSVITKVTAPEETLNSAPSIVVS